MDMGQSRISDTYDFAFEHISELAFGWANRTLEASADPVDVPWAWRVYAYRGYLLLQTLDR